MFTGIVEEVGKIKSIISGANSAKICISAKKILEDVSLGDSIAVNGICLTVVDYTESNFTADVMHETINKSSFNNMKCGTTVNLERAMSANGRFGGHIVSGHIDGIGEIIDKHKDDNAIWFKIRTKHEIMKYIIKKGSIAIDGISLTVAKVEDDNFSVSIIPHTMKNTILVDKNRGDVVNLENDSIGKYVEKLLSFGISDVSDSYKNKFDGSKSSRKIDINFLGENGFI